MKIEYLCKMHEGYSNRTSCRQIFQSRLITVIRLRYLSTLRLEGRNNAIRLP